MYKYKKLMEMQNRDYIRVVYTFLYKVLKLVMKRSCVSRMRCMEERRKRKRSDSIL